ncbi:hypothetical protein HT578_12975 [Novosphingobium decolorationis]|uniref:DoxX family protein n=1 Tax=Novosphingobium decolorationis TaxID=2698673 RepID=A0ABX8E6Q0_9SPHN|nr:hypothetical protein HT578_12975 [Novosphingobium decolorationis]
MQGDWHRGASRVRLRDVTIAVLVVFCLGVINFAAHKAVLESGHPMLAQVPWLLKSLGGRASLIVEFVMLLGALLMVSAGSQGWALLYLVYSLVNGVAAWLIVTERL